MNNTGSNTDTDKKKLSLQYPDNGSFSSTNNTPPNTPVFNPNLINTKHLSIDIQTWNDFDETNNQIPTMDVSPIYANNNPYSRKSTHHNQPHTKRKPNRNYHNGNGNGNGNGNWENRSCLMKILLYLFGGDSHNI